MTTKAITLQSSNEIEVLIQCHCTREEMFRLLEQVSDCAEAWKEHAWRHKRISGKPVA